MNTIPLTFDEHQINRTILGGQKNNSSNALNISVVLLNTSGSHFKDQLFENLLSCGFEQIVSVEHDPNNFSLDDLVKRFPSIKFIVPLEKVTQGEMINLAMSEITSDYVLVLRDNLVIPSGIILTNLAEKLTQTGTYCIVPRVKDSKKISIDANLSPFIMKKHFVVEASGEVTDGMNTLYPYDFIALYNRKKFIQLGGFDYTIQSEYWQNLDLALRSWLWGEETKITTLLQFTYAEDSFVEDKTLNLDYLRFYLKNILPRFKIDRSIIKKRQFFTFAFNSSCGFLEARRQFSAARKWVNENRFKFKRDIIELVEEWRSL